ncbi:hypothetical protein [Cobetia crustatorum]|uniref:Uncharacterized protein n=1 Tax=Cobetia crustatorum TaxID=553385 RepID=A0A558HX11_9GAMM|nr:hypothetical protein [Cobetia crustatorum]TVU73676.1 hypothetical protein FQP86_00945 [Cobetia crustatorum]
MDPVTLTLAAFLKVVTHLEPRDIVDVYDSRVQQLRVLYYGYNIDFRHQLWRIDSASVCESITKSGSPAEQRECSMMASRLFVETCHALQQRGRAAHIETRTMYCKAAATYKPLRDPYAGMTAAQREARKSLEAAQQRAEHACNRYVLDALSSSSLEVLRLRQRYCNESNRLSSRLNKP